MGAWRVGVSGLIGAGKTTLVRGLARELGWEGFEERFDPNPYLPHFYADPATWAFRNYMFFFEQAFSDQAAAFEVPNGAVQERVLDEHLQIFGAESFGRGYLDDDDFALLTRLTNTAVRLAGRPQLLVHIDIDPALAFERARSRSHRSERGIELEYLEALSQRYPTFLRKWPTSILKIDGAEHDFRSAGEIKKIASTVLKELEKSPQRAHADQELANLTGD